MRTRLHPSATRPGQIAWLTALLLLLGTACGDSQPEAQPGPPKAPEAAEATPPPAADPAPDGTGIEELIGAGMIPDGFPDDMPLFPAAEASNWMAPPGAGTLVLFDSSASPDEVFAFYVEELPGQGWEIEFQENQPGLREITAVKGNRTARISLSDSDGGTQFGVAVSELY